jgi:hypothetical protein
MPEAFMDARRQLELRVIRNARLQVVEDGPRQVILEVAVTYPRWLGPLPQWLGAKSQRRLVLTGLGLQVWRRIDDRATVGGLIDWVATEQRVGFHEARLLTLQYLQQLSQRGMLVLGA